MYPYRVTTRAVPRACRQGSAACGSGSSRNIFSAPFLTPTHHFNPAAEFNGLFRLLDNAAAELLPRDANAGARTSVRQFTPRFDVKEVGSTYELQGELPGIKQKDLEIEFVDERTLVIRGRSEREVIGGNIDSAKAVEDATASADKAIANDVDDAASQKSSSSTTYHKASVEDEYVDAGEEANTATTNEKAAADNQGDLAQATETSTTKNKPAEPAYKYWVSERSVGEFERRFNFPGRVDQDAVTASLKNGILSVVVPKIVEKGARRIEVQ